MCITITQVELIEWDVENLSGKKDNGILRRPITNGTGIDSPKELAEVESKSHFNI